MWNTGSHTIIITIQLHHQESPWRCHLLVLHMTRTTTVWWRHIDTKHLDHVTSQSNDFIKKSYNWRHRWTKTSVKWCSSDVIRVWVTLPILSVSWRLYSNEDCITSGLALYTYSMYSTTTTITTLHVISFSSNLCGIMWDLGVGSNTNISLF